MCFPFTRTHARTHSHKKNSRVKSPTKRGNGLSSNEGRNSRLNNSDHVAILKILNEGWCKGKAMDLQCGGPLFRSSPDTGCA